MAGSAVLSLYMKAKEDFQTEVVNAQAEMEDQIRVCSVLSGSIANSLMFFINFSASLSPENDQKFPGYPGC